MLTVSECSAILGCILYCIPRHLSCLSYSLSVRPCYNINIDRGQPYILPTPTRKGNIFKDVWVIHSILRSLFLLLYDLISGNSKLNLWKQRLTINLLSWFYFYLGSRDWEILMVYFSSLLGDEINSRASPS